MARTHDDSWDLASSVGATATMIAAGRAMATKDPRGLINDPFAEPLVRAVGLDFFTKMMDGDLDLDVIENASPERVQALIEEWRCAPGISTITSTRPPAPGCARW